MNRFQPLDVSNASIGVHLYPSEEVLLLTEGVGLYSGPSKSLPHSSGTVYLTSHRIFYVDEAQPHRHSCYLVLSIIRETQYYAGFLKSSAKVTLGFRAEEDDDDGDENSQGSQIARPKSADERRAVTGNDDNRSSRSSDKPQSSMQDPARSNGPTSAPVSSSSSLSYAKTRNSNEVAAGRGGDWRIGARPHDIGTTAIPRRSWVCRVCAFSNALDPGSDQVSAVKCQLCGVSTSTKDLTFDTSLAQGNPQRGSTPVSSRPEERNGGNAVSSSSSTKTGLTCPACTFSNHPSMLRCEICDTPLGTINIQQEFALQQQAKQEVSLSRRASTKSEGATAAEDTHNSVRLSFRKGGDKAFYELLKPTLRRKRWAQNSSEGSQSNKQSTSFHSKHANIDGRASHSNTNGLVRRVGIEGIMSAVDLQAREDSSDMQDALRDLEALMTRAKKMVDFAEALNAKLAKQETAKEATGTSSVAQPANNGDEVDHDEAASMIRSSLVRLGLPAPAITADMARDEYEYNVELARELGGLLYSPKAPIIGKGQVLRHIKVSADLLDPSLASQDGRSRDLDGQGILPLDEVWCIWNRARGVALVSPRELLAVTPLLPRLTQPQIECKTFASGLKVLHTPRFADAILSRRVCSLLQQREVKMPSAGLGGDSDEMNLVETLRAGPLTNVATPSDAGISTLELARLEECPLHLMDELLGDIEQRLGTIVRDEHAGSTTWFLNHFSHLNAQSSEGLSRPPLFLTSALI